MEWQYTFNDPYQIMEVKVFGHLEKGSLDEMARENLREIQKRGYTKCLLDYTETTGTLETLDIYHRPGEITQMGITQKYRIAMLVPKNRLGEFRFLETVYKNNNFDLEVFEIKERSLQFLRRN